jgi:hypothetical protein
VYDDQTKITIESAIRDCVKAIAEAMPKYAEHLPAAALYLQPGAGAMFRCIEAVVPFRVVIVYRPNLPAGDYIMKNGGYVLDEFGDKIRPTKGGHFVTVDAFVSEEE